MNNQSGIFEMLNSPVTQGILAGGLGALASRGTTAQAIGRGGLLGLSAYGQAEKTQRATLLEEAKKKERDAAFASISPHARGGYTADWGALLKSGQKADDLDALRNFGRDKVKEFQDVRMPDGGVQRYGFTEYGGTINTGATPFSEFKAMDFGGNQAAFDPVSGSVYDLGRKTGSHADFNAARNADLAERRLQLDTQRHEWDMSKPSEASKAPPGYRWTQSGGLEAIPGGPADEKATLNGQKAEQRRQGAVLQADRMIASADGALKQMDRWMTTGVSGELMSNIPGSDANDLRATLGTIKANLGFAELQAMREASPTGGALGSVAVQELQALQSTVANLDTNQSEAQLRANLQKIKTHYANMREVLQGKVPKGYDAGGQSWGNLAQEYEKQGMPREVIRQVLQSQGQDPSAWGY